MSPLYIALSLAALAVLMLGLVLMRRLWLARRQWFAVGALRAVTVDRVLPAVFVITTRGCDGEWLYSFTDQCSYPVSWCELGGGKHVQLQQPRTIAEGSKDHGATSVSEIAQTIRDARAALEAMVQIERQTSRGRSA